MRVWEWWRGLTLAACGFMAGAHATAAESRSEPAARPLPRLEWRPSANPDAPAASEANRVMTDTLDYCAHLAAIYDMVRRSGGSSDPADDLLARDGLTMCRHGKVRMGVHALRRALVGFGP